MVDLMQYYNIQVQLYFADESIQLRYVVITIQEHSCKIAMYQQQQLIIIHSSKAADLTLQGP